MRRHLVTLTVALLVTTVVPLAADTAPDTAPPVACPADDGRPRLTVAGYEATFEAPAVTYPGLSSPVNNSVGPERALRSAPHPFTLDVAPSADAGATFRLDWQGVSDFDVFVFDDETGMELGRSAEANIENGQTTFEELPLEGLAHCQRLSVIVTSWAGSAGESLTLTVKVTPGETLLACAADDPAPNCAGKAAGDAPEPSPADSRTRLYLGGDPGQASMVWHFANRDDLPKGRLVADRPTSGKPNGHTRAVAGFRDQFRNPFVPHWTGRLAETRPLVGDATAVLWVSSRTMDATGEFVVDLYVDGSLAGQVKVPGSAIGSNPTRLAVRFPALDIPEASEVTLQAATEPAASSGGPGNPAHAEVTVHYGSVQFPAFVALP